MTDPNVTRTQEQAVADQMDCDLDRFVRRALNQAERAPQHRKHWENVAHQLDVIRGLVRWRMHEADRSATQ
jgi:hypothetical protein